MTLYYGLEVSYIVLIGFKNSPFFTQCIIDIILVSYCFFSITYLDNIAIYSVIFREYCQYFYLVLSIIKKFRIMLLLEKFFYRYFLVQLLGFFINRFSILITEERLVVYRKLKFLGTLKELKIYLGITVFLKKIILYYYIKVTLLEI